MGRFIHRVMSGKYRIELDELALRLVLDALENRAKSLDKTAAYLFTGESPPNFILEVCSDAEEAILVARYYRSIIAKIKKQRRTQL